MTRTVRGRGRGLWWRRRRTATRQGALCPHLGGVFRLAFPRHTRSTYWDMRLVFLPFVPCRPQGKGDKARRPALQWPDPRPLPPSGVARVWPCLVDPIAASRLPSHSESHTYCPASGPLPCALPCPLRFRHSAHSESRARRSAAFSAGE